MVRFSAIEKVRECGVEDTSMIPVLILSSSYFSNCFENPSPHLSINLLIRFSKKTDGIQSGWNGNFRVCIERLKLPKSRKLSQRVQSIKLMCYLLRSSPSNCLQPEIYSGTCLPPKSALSVTLFILISKLSLNINIFNVFQLN